MATHCSSSGQEIHVGAALEILSAEIKPAWRFSRGLIGPQAFVIESVALTENVKLLEGQNLKAVVYNVGLKCKRIGCWGDDKMSRV